MIRTEQQSKAQKGGERGWGREGKGEGGWGRYQLRYIGEEYKPFI